MAKGRTATGKVRKGYKLTKSGRVVKATGAKPKARKRGKKKRFLGIF